MCHYLYVKRKGNNKAMPHKIKVRRADSRKSIWICEPGELFTGFVDIQGSEIWEGDTVKWFRPFATPAIGKIFYNEEDCSFRLKFNDAGIEDRIIGRYIAGKEMLKVGEGKI